MTVILKFYPLDSLTGALGYLKTFRPGAYDGRGQVEFTDHVQLAMRFRDAGAALAFWKQQSTVRPLRPDGKANRPLTAYHAEIIKEGSDGN